MSGCFLFVFFYILEPVAASRIAVKHGGLAVRHDLLAAREKCYTGPRPVCEGDLGLPWMSGGVGGRSVGSLPDLLCG